MSWNRLPFFPDRKKLVARTVQSVGQISKQTKVTNSLNKLVSVEAREYEYVRDQAQGIRWFQLLPRHNCLCESILRLHGLSSHKSDPRKWMISRNVIPVIAVDFGLPFRTTNGEAFIHVHSSIPVLVIVVTITIPAASSTAISSICQYRIFLFHWSLCLDNHHKTLFLPYIHQKSYCYVVTSGSACDCSLLIELTLEDCCEELST